MEEYNNILTTINSIISVLTLIYSIYKKYVYDNKEKKIPTNINNILDRV